jgi:hypothetical protein
MVEPDLILLAPIDGRSWVGVYRYLQARVGRDEFGRNETKNVRTSDQKKVLYVRTEEGV